MMTPVNTTLIVVGKINEKPALVVTTLGLYALLPDEYRIKLRDDRMCEVLDILNRPARPVDWRPDWKRLRIGDTYDLSRKECYDFIPSYRPTLNLS